MVSRSPEVFAGSQTYPTPSPGPAVTIGNFDGVHRGHRQLLERTVARAREVGGPACVYTFHPAPRDVLRPDNDIPRIQTLDDKIAALGRAGIEQVVVERFDRSFARQSPEDFAHQILRDRLGAAAVVVGWDFRFGRKRAGTVQGLRELLQVPVEQVGAYAPEGEVISSSRIRQAVRQGQVAEAARLLGRPHEVVGTVIHGDARGRELGFPTANVAPDTPLVPGQGVYAVRMDTGDGVLRPGAANVGTRPTFDGGEVRIEVHLLDFDGDLYDRRVRVHWVARIRDEERFDGIEALKRAMADDLRRTRELLA